MEAHDDDSGLGDACADRSPGSGGPGSGGSGAGGSGHGGFDRERHPSRLSVTESSAGVRVLSVGAEFDAAAAAELRRELNVQLARSLNPLVVDLTAVNAVTEHAAAALRFACSEAGDADVDLRIACDPRSLVLRGGVFDDESLFEVYPTLAAALTGQHRFDR